MAEISERKQVDAEWVVEQLIENYHRSMQAKPVLNSDGEPTGEYTYQGAVANKALELLGKHFGMFVTKVDIRALIEHRGVIALPEIADEDAWLNLSGKTVKELPKAN